MTETLFNPLSSDSPARTGRRLAAIPPSGTMEVSRQVRALRAADRSVIHLGGGAPSPAPGGLYRSFTFTPEMNLLGDPAGVPPLRAAIAAKLKAEQGLAYDPDSDIVVTIGAKQGLHAALLALIEPGEEVAVLDPGWVTYGPSVTLAGGVARAFSLDRADGNRLDGAALEAVIGPKTRAVIVNTPHNPTGRVFTRAELQGIAHLAAERGLWVIADESFDKYVFGGNRHLGIATLPGMRERTLILQSFSKAYGFIGGRVGYLAAPAGVAALVRRYNEHVLSCVSPFLQSIALDLLGEEPAWSERLRAEYQRKRDRAVAAVRAIPGFACDVPEGTFYLWCDIAAFEKTSADFAGELLEEAGVAVTPGSAFGPGGEGFVRINLAGEMASIEEGLGRLERYIARRRG